MTTVSAANSSGEQETERKRADETIRSLLRISERLNSTLEVEVLMDILVQEAIGLVGASAGVSGLYTAEGMVCRKYFEAGNQLALEYCWPPMHGLPGWLIVHKVPYLTNDAMADTQIVHELCVQFGVKSALSTPILNTHGEILGFFEIHNKDGGFTEADKQKLLAISHSAAIAIQNALAYRRLQEAEQSLRESERTQRILAEIGSLGGRATARAMGIEVMVRSIRELVATELKVSRCGLSQVDTDAGLVIVEQDTHIGIDPPERPVAIADYTNQIIEDALAGRTSIIADVANDPRTAAQYDATYKPIAVQAYISVPLYRNGKWVANFWISSQDPRHWSNGEVTFMQTVADRVWQVVEQARVATALRESEERFAKFMEHLPGLAWIKDLQGRYVFANEAAERAFGKTQAQLYARTDEEVFPAETAAAFRENDRRAVAGESGIQTMETLEQADGVHHSLVHKFPIPGPDGRIALVGGMAIDITERMKAEDALRESEQRYRAVVESQAEMVCRFRPDGTILFVNGAYARTRATSPEALIGRNFWDFIAEEDRRPIRALLDRLAPESPEIRIENRFRTPEGERWTLWTNRALAFDSSGCLLEAQSTGIDITDRKLAEDALQRANEGLCRANADLEQFAYSASHDLQEPIRNISICSEMLSNHYGHTLDPEASEHLSFITMGARRMEMLLRDLLAYTQSTNIPENTSGETDATLALEKALADLSVAISESDAKIVFDRLPTVRVPEVQLQQIFQNLLSNAIKYRRDREPPRIEVFAVRKDREWQFSVRDNGIGIPPQYRQRVFGIFKRLHRDGKYAGTGIGLAICQRIVEQNGGRIWVESDETNRGSVFCFTLPAEGRL